MPDWSKIHPTLAAHLSTRAASSISQRLPIIIRYVDATPNRGGDVEGVDAPRLTFHLIHATANLATRSAIEKLSELDAVQMIWMDQLVHSVVDQAREKIGVPEAWKAGLTGKGVRIGIIDSGIDPRHPDLVGRIAQAKDLTGEGPEDENGHGTLAAGIIGGTGAASDGRLAGVAPESVLLVAKVIHADGWSNSSTVMAGIEWAIHQKAQIINLSLGTDSADDGSDALSAMCDAATAKGVLICAAAGNGGPKQSTITSPGCAASVVTVGASDKEDQIASFSSRGPTKDGRSKPDICAPGVQIVGCRASGTSLGEVVDDYYTSCSGTSVATPFVTGAAALALESSPGLPPAEIKRILSGSAKRLAGDANAQGAGRVEITSVLEQRKSPDLPSPESAPADRDSEKRSGCLAVLRNLFGGR